MVDEPVRARPSPPSVKPDTESTEAFPSLAPSALTGGQRTTSTWGTAPRIKATVSKQSQFSDTFTIPVGDLSTAGRDGKPTSLGEVMKRTMNQFKVKIEASTNQKSRQTTFYLRSENQRDVEKAKKNLLAGLSPVVRVLSRRVSLRRLQTIYRSLWFCTPRSRLFLASLVPRAPV